MHDVDSALERDRECSDGHTRLSLLPHRNLGKRGKKRGMREEKREDGVREKESQRALRVTESES